MRIAVVSLAIALFMQCACTSGAQAPCSLPLTQILVAHTSDAQGSPASEIVVRTAIIAAVSATLRGLSPGGAFALVTAARPAKLVYTGTVSTNTISAAVLAMSGNSSGPSDLAGGLRFLQHHKGAPASFNLALIVDNRQLGEASFADLLERAHRDGALHLLIEPVGVRSGGVQVPLPSFSTLIQRPEDIRRWVAAQQQQPARARPKYQAVWERGAVIFAALVVLLIFLGFNPLKKDHRVKLQRRAMSDEPRFEPDEDRSVLIRQKIEAESQTAPQFSILILPEGRRLTITEESTQMGSSPLAEVYIEAAVTTLSFCRSPDGLEITNTGFKPVYIGSLPLSADQTVTLPPDVTADCRITADIMLRMSCQEVVHA